MKYAVLSCPKCGWYQTTPYPFESVKCYQCGARLDQKNVVAIAHSREQATLIAKEMRKQRESKKKLRKAEEQLGFDKSYLDLYKKD